jgi:hypothetical protein
MNPGSCADTNEDWGGFSPKNFGAGGRRVKITGEDVMKKTRCLIAGVGIGLCLCTIANGDDDQIPKVRNAARPVVVKRVVVVADPGDRVIYVRQAYPVQSIVPVNRSRYSIRATPAQRRVETSPSPIHESDNHVAKTIKTNNGSETGQSEQQAAKDNKSTDRKPEAKQPEDVSALDRLTVQAQKEEAIRLAEPGGIEPR